MKKIIICLASVALGVGLLLGERASVGQEQARPAAAAATAHQVGLIDMAHVFKEYAKFKALSESLKADVEGVDGEAKGLVQALQQMQARLTSGTLAQGSQEYADLESQILTKATELESFRKVKQREFLRKEADIYKTVYLEVQDAVSMYAKHYNYTLIMRFNRDKVESAEDPQAIIQSMNRPVVYHRTQDDLTDPILKYLNDQYTRTAARPAAPAAGTRTN
ncbi:MAG: OmpH family outer membrane protein [Planctomycetaceae bacterium]|nr:OmpH family outer membrane protein [Planctomycetaceae bacterium]